MPGLGYPEVSHYDKHSGQIDYSVSTIRARGVQQAEGGRRQADKGWVVAFEAEVHLSEDCIVRAFTPPALGQTGGGGGGGGGQKALDETGVSCELPETNGKKATLSIQNQSHPVLLTYIAIKSYTARAFVILMGHFLLCSFLSLLLYSKASLLAQRRSSFWQKVELNTSNRLDLFCIQHSSDSL